VVKTLGFEVISPGIQEVGCSHIHQEELLKSNQPMKIHLIGCVAHISSTMLKRRYDFNPILHTRIKREFVGSRLCENVIGQDLSVTHLYPLLDNLSVVALVAAERAIYNAFYTTPIVLKGYCRTRHAINTCSHFIIKQAAVCNVKDNLTLLLPPSVERIKVVYRKLGVTHGPGLERLFKTIPNTVTSIVFDLDTTRGGIRCDIPPHITAMLFIGRPITMDHLIHRYIHELERRESHIETIVTFEHRRPMSTRTKRRIWIAMPDAEHKELSGSNLISASLLITNERFLFVHAIYQSKSVDPIMHTHKELRNVNRVISMYDPEYVHGENKYQFFEDGRLKETCKQSLCVHYPKVQT